MKQARTRQATAKRLEYLSGMLAKYSHRWGETPSQRMFDWVDEFNAIKRNDREGYRGWCDQNGYSYDVDAYDALA